MAGKRQKLENSSSSMAHNLAAYNNTAPAHNNTNNNLANSTSNNPNSGQNPSKKASQVGRTLLACELCRKQKTRCFRDPDNTACMRCTFLKKACSLETDKGSPNGGASVIPTTFNLSADMRSDKLDQIQKGINDILGVLQQQQQHQRPSSVSSSNDNFGYGHRHAIHNVNSQMYNRMGPSHLNAIGNNILQAFSSGLPTTGLGGGIEKGSMSSPSGLSGTGPSLKKDDGATPRYDQFSIPQQSGSSGPKATPVSVISKTIDENLTFQTPTNSYEASPFSIMLNQIPFSNIPYPVLDLLGLSYKKPENALQPMLNDIISKGIISEDEAIDMMNDFRRNYGRWILFPLNMSTSILVDRIRYKSSLLLTTCFCLTLRYSLNGIRDPELLQQRKRIHRLLIRELSTDLNKAFNKYLFKGYDSGHIEFLQALVLLSIYSLSLSSMAKNAFDGIPPTESDINDDLDELRLDPWFLSGIGLQIFVTKSSFGSLLSTTRQKQQESLKRRRENMANDVNSPVVGSELKTGTGSVPGAGTGPESPFTIFYDELDLEEFQKLSVLRTYNHLTLVHLINCIFSGRMCAIDKIRLSYSTATLSLPSSTNFDGRMVSEIGILLVAYNYIQESLHCNSSISTRECEEAFSQVKEGIRDWYSQWEYLFSQPAPQFVELCYHFCCMMIYFSYTYQKIILINGELDDRNLSISITDFYNENNLLFLLQYADEISLAKLLMHALNLVRFINVIESDSYFAYLLDQIHFCFFFAGIMLVRLFEENSRREVNRNPFSLREINEIQDDIKLLILKFEMMRKSTNSPDDMSSRYRHGLQESFDKVFKDKVATKKK